MKRLRRLLLFQLGVVALAWSEPLVLRHVRYDLALRIVTRALFLLRVKDVLIGQVSHEGPV